MSPPTTRASEPSGEDAQRREPPGRAVAGICGGDAPPLLGRTLTGTGLTLDEAARRLANDEPLPSLTPIQRRLVEERAATSFPFP